VAQEVLRHFCFNRSGKRKRLFQKFKGITKTLIQNKLECWQMPLNCTLV
jgi:hypothetical protein